MKVVLVTQRLVENDAYPETRECLDVRWGRFCATIGVLPVPLPIEQDPAKYVDTLDPSGVILTGGNDLASASPGPLSEKRDAFEKRLYGFAVERQIPVLAVCRGMQLVASIHGAELERVSGHTRGERHGLVWNRELLPLASVRSYHDWGLRSAPGGFVELARAEDGVVEAMQHEARPIFCQMWHPEREERLTDAETTFYTRFFETKARS